MNKVSLLGNVGQDPRINVVNDKKVASFSLATKKYNKGTDWHNIVCWGKTAELIETYVKKGDSIVVIGPISYGKYEKDGVEVNKTEIIANEIEFVNNKNRDNQNTNQDTPSIKKDDVPF